MNIRPLTPADSEQLKSVIHNRSNFIGVQEEYLSAHEKLSFMSLTDLITLSPIMGTVYGAFEGEELQGYVVTVLSDAQPCYFVRRAQTRTGSKLSTLSELFAYLIQDHESRGFNRFYTLYRKDDIALYHRLWRTTSVLKNYITYTDLEIAPNTRSKHSDFWEALCGRTLTPDITVVRGFIRKSETMFFNETEL